MGLESRFQEEKPISAGGRDEIRDCLDDLPFSPSGDSWGIGTLGLLLRTCWGKTRKRLLDRAGTFSPLLVSMSLISIRLSGSFGKNKQTNKKQCKTARWVCSSSSKPETVSNSPILSLYESYYLCVWILLSLCPLITTAVPLPQTRKRSKLLNNHWCLYLHVCQLGTVCIHIFFHVALLSISVVLLHESRYLAMFLPE